jgi:hypothetical protein
MNIVESLPMAVPLRKTRKYPRELLPLDFVALVTPAELSMLDSRERAKTTLKIVISSMSLDEYLFFPGG